ncbi:MAG: HigA family addiction module antitoxin [Gammaproteobacteria bacterium]
MSKLKNIHPGEILREEFILLMGLSQNKLARSINVPPRRINEIVLEKRSITADTALRLAKFFGTSPDFWMNLQQEYDLEEKRKQIKNILGHIVHFNYSNKEHLKNIY